MPILVNRGPGDCHIVVEPDTPAERMAARRQPKGGEWIEIGLLNNMPEAALASTEQQFLGLLGAAAGDSWIHLRFFSLPGVPRSERGRGYLSRSYSDLGDVGNADLDGLIVTGTEPKAANLADEPYWAPFTKLVDWAEHNTYSTIWSCLAAHAAVLHLDGIGRIALNEKRFGLFDCDTVADHPLTEGLPARSAIPHSRWNDLGEAMLVSKGYQVFPRSREAGVDTFTRQRQSLFLFFKGHPEYDGRSLFNEYRRDVGRFLRGERDRYPELPPRYFDDATAVALTAFRQRACAERREELFAEFPVPAEAIASGGTAWRAFAVGIYRNWLNYLSAQKRRLQPPTRYLAALRLDKSPAPAV
jgi:homoserine O-succinyltransferase